MTFDEYKCNVIVRRAEKIRKTAKVPIEYMGVFRSLYKREPRIVVRMYFALDILQDFSPLEKWRKRLLADHYMVDYEKGKWKVSFYCRLGNFWWKWLKCSFC